MNRAAWFGVVLVLIALGGGTIIYARNAEARANEEKYRPHIDAAERRYTLPRGLLHRLLYQESRFRSDIITGKLKSAKGAIGIAQFMPVTAARYGVNPLDPVQAIDGAARYLRDLYAMFNNWRLAIAGYNAGEGNVKKYGGVPPFAETREYVASIARDVGLV